ncbi:MAG: hypothetical protein ACI814_002993, partial [Mariniblastus sp.]
TLEIPSTANARIATANEGSRIMLKTYCVEENAVSKTA